MPSADVAESLDKGDVVGKLVRRHRQVLVPDPEERHVVGEPYLGEAARHGGAHVVDRLSDGMPAELRVDVVVDEVAVPGRLELAFLSRPAKPAAPDAAPDSQNLASCSRGGPICCHRCLHRGAIFHAEFSRDVPCRGGDHLSQSIG